MERIALQTARIELSRVVNRVTVGGERIVIQRHGKDAVALVTLDDLERLRELDEAEDRSDVEAAESALAEAERMEAERPGSGFPSLDQLRAALSDAPPTNP